MTTNPPIPPALREAVIEAMKNVFGDDRRRIDRAMAVLEAAEHLLGEIAADPVVVTAAAILHDIGIAAAERKHGSSAARYQELEGPPIARPILETLQVDPERIDHVCDIIANHHCAAGRDSPEFRLLWDADVVINLMPQSPPPPGDPLQKMLADNFRTDAGCALAAERFQASRR